MGNIYLSHCALHIGFHGCDRSIGEKLLSDSSIIKPSVNDYDWFRRLDCALINYINQITDTTFKNDLANKGYSSVKPFDTVRGCFTEGAKIPGTEIFEKTHIQVCIRNSACIKGIFRPRIN